MTTHSSDENIKQHIKDQIAFNSGKNLFADEHLKSLKMIEVTESLVEKIQQMDAETEKEMINFMADEALQEFCRVNQYFAFNTESVNELKRVYSELNQNIRNLNATASKAELDDISREHYLSLCDWLVRTNAFASKMY